MGDTESREQDRRDDAQEAREAGVPLAYYAAGIGEPLPQQQPFIDAALRGSRAEMRSGRKGPQWVEVANVPPALAERPVQPCPECLQGKHPNCDGTSWDVLNDEPAGCPCAESRHDWSDQ